MTYTIRIRTMSARTTFVEVEESTTILQVKQQIFEKEDFPVQYQLLIFAGTPLEDEKNCCLLRHHK